MGVACSKCATRRPLILIASRAKLRTQIGTWIHGHSRRLEQTAKVRLPHAGWFRPSQIVSKVKFPARPLGHPRPSLLQRNFSMTAVIRLGCDAAGHHSPDFFAVTTVT